MTALAMSLVLLVVVPGFVGAQSGIYTSSISGDTLEWSADWMLGTSEYDEDEGVERRSLYHPTDFVILNIKFATSILDRAQARESMLETFKDGTESYRTLDSGDYEHIAYELSTFSIDQGEMGSFILVMTGDGTTIVHVVAPVSLFAAGIESVQGSIFINGAPVLHGIDGSGLQIQLDAIPDTSAASDSRDSKTELEDAKPGIYTDETWDYFVEYPVGWLIADDGSGDFDLVNSEGTVSVSFAAIEVPGLDGEALELSMNGLFTAGLGSSGTLLTSESSESRAVFVGEADGTIVIQEWIIHAPSVVIVVTVVITGDYEANIDQIREVTLEGVEILSLL